LTRPNWQFNFRDDAMKILVGRLRGNTFLRYLVVSVGALATDMAVFLLLLSVGVSSVAASAIGYSVGILAHWILSSRKVFQDRVSERGTSERTQQKAMFVMSALLGLATTRRNRCVVSAHLSVAQYTHLPVKPDKLNCGRMANRS
jgi:putative flippase GtrA